MTRCLGVSSLSSWARLDPVRATIRQIKNYAHISEAPRFLLSSRFKRRQRIGIESPANGTRLVIAAGRSEEHTSELQSLMRISYAVFCLKKKNNTKLQTDTTYPLLHT